MAAKDVRLTLIRSDQCGVRIGSERFEAHKLQRIACRRQRWQPLIDTEEIYLTSHRTLLAFAGSTESQTSFHRHWFFEVSDRIAALTEGLGAVAATALHSVSP